MAKAEIVLGESGGGKGITAITGAQQQETQFTAIVGHRYLVAFSSFSYSTGQTPVIGLNVEIDSGLLETAAYSGNTTRLRMVIGTATSTTVHCSYRSDDISAKPYANLIWIDLDAQ